jgi:DNA-binding response OmpR family regulator
MELTIDEHPRPRPVEASPRAPRVPVRVRILVADDDDSIAGLLEHTLRRDGYDVLRARSGAEVVNLAAQQSPDLILLDIAMPELDGLAACRALRAERRLARIPIVILTARVVEAAILAGFADGATDYIAKPFSVAQVRARVRSWLARAASPSG